METINTGSYQLQFQLMPIPYDGETQVCADYKCDRPIGRGDQCFFDLSDVQNGRPAIYCDGCGKMIRYQRRKQEQRDRAAQPLKGA